MKNIKLSDEEVTQGLLLILTAWVIIAGLLILK